MALYEFLENTSLLQHAPGRKTYKVLTGFRNSICFMRKINCRRLGTTFWLKYKTNCNDGPFIPSVNAAVKLVIQLSLKTRKSSCVTARRRIPAACWVHLFPNGGTPVMSRGMGCLGEGYLCSVWGTSVLRNGGTPILFRGTPDKGSGTPCVGTDTRERISFPVLRAWAVTMKLFQNELQPHSVGVNGIWNGNPLPS